MLKKVGRYRYLSARLPPALPASAFRRRGRALKAGSALHAPNPPTSPPAPLGRGPPRTRRWPARSGLHIPPNKGDLLRYMGSSRRLEPTTGQLHLPGTGEPPSGEKAGPTARTRPLSSRSSTRNPTIDRSSAPQPADRQDTRARRSKPPRRSRVAFAAGYTSPP